MALKISRGRWGKTTPNLRGKTQVGARLYPFQPCKGYGEPGDQEEDETPLLMLEDDELSEKLSGTELHF